MTNQNKLTLRMLTKNDENAFYDWMKEWHSSEVSWACFDWKDGMSFGELVDRLDKNAAGLDLAYGKVPSSFLFAFVDDVIVGRLHFRHRLNDSLRWHGGHIGYSVSLNNRRKGYATEMLRQALELAKQMNIPELLLTVDTSNRESIGVIHKFAGAMLQDILWDEALKKYIRRYWIDPKRGML